MPTLTQPALGTGYIDACTSPTLDLNGPRPSGYLQGTAPRYSYSGLLGYYSPLTAFGSGGPGLPGGPRVIAGVVRDPDGNPVDGYTVRLYSQDTGQLLASTTSAGGGLFSFDQLDTNLYYVVAVDNVAETWKAPIVDLVTPVVP